MALSFGLVFRHTGCSSFRPSSPTGPAASRARHKTKAGDRLLSLQRAKVVRRVRPTMCGFLQAFRDNHARFAKYFDMFMLDQGVAKLNAKAPSDIHSKAKRLTKPAC